MRLHSMTLFATLLCASGPAFAQAHPSTTSMNCRAAASLVQSRGSVVLDTGAGTFDRFVRDAGFCPRGQVLKPAFERTTDQTQCQIGWRCMDESKENR